MFKLPQLQFATDALEPYMSAKTLEMHYNVIHRRYVDNLNALIKGTFLEGVSDLDTIMQLDRKMLKRDPRLLAIWHNACQHAWHSLFWESLEARDPNQEYELPSDDQFDFKWFTAEVTEHFGDGWVAWTQFGTVVTIHETARPPEGTLIVCDIWEHAYLLDHGPERLDYVNAFYKIVDWSLLT